MAPPRISIITPSFNQAAFIEQTISSVVRQGYSNLEYIVIDGGSTDGSVDIIRKFASSLAYWVSEKDRGQAHAINKGLERATGEIIAYLNSDDCYLDGTLARVAKAFSKHPEVDLLHGRCRIIDEQGAKIGERIGCITRYEEILDLWDVWWKDRNFVQPEVFWTKRIGDTIGRFREDLFWVMDYDYWLRILKAGGRVGFVNAELAAFRVQPNQKSKQPERTAEELLQVVRPYIFRGHEIPLKRNKRILLQGHWLYDSVFRKAADRSVAFGHSKGYRWLQLAGLAIRYPQLWLVPEFRDRVLGMAQLG